MLIKHVKKKTAVLLYLYFVCVIWFLLDKIQLRKEFLSKPGKIVPFPTTEDRGKGMWREVYH